MKLIDERTARMIFSLLCSSTTYYNIGIRKQREPLKVPLGSAKVEKRHKIKNIDNTYIKIVMVMRTTMSINSITYTNNDSSSSNYTVIILVHIVMIMTENSNNWIIIRNDSKNYYYQ
jgi:hypothetical protein